MNGTNVIDVFLARWKQRAVEYYTNLFNEYSNQRKLEYEVTVDNLKNIHKDQWTPNKPKYSQEQIDNIMKDISDGENYWAGGILIRNLKVQIYTSKLNEWKSKYSKSEINVIENMTKKDYLDKILNKEVEYKKKSLIARVEKKAGKIVDASFLVLGLSGEINGYIIGEKEKVFVRTIFAGGHNIQRLHYRTIIT